jgi:hypothetical protein
MQAQRIRSVWRSRCEDTREGPALVRARVSHQHLAPCLVKPGDDNDFGTDCDPLEGPCQRWFHLQPGVGRSFNTLFRCFGTPLESRSDDPDGMQAATFAWRRDALLLCFPGDFLGNQWGTSRSIPSQPWRGEGLIPGSSRPTEPRSPSPGKTSPLATRAARRSGAQGEPTGAAAAQLRRCECS